jgi:hypothetical protein
MKKSELRSIIEEELNIYFQTHPYSELDEWLITEEIIIGELLNPNYAYPYHGEKGYYEYKDMNNVTFFVRMTYQAIKWDENNEGYMEFKTGWINDDNKAIYEPSVPPNSIKSSTIDKDKRSDTVAKIYKDEILPLFEKQKLTNIMLIKPISSSRMKFAERLVKKFTPLDKFDIEYGSPLIITKKNNEK